ncbi:MAG: response regulator [Candidatus Liptonbacteria bacterium]|nr:response regulator [Candidatus Liptonbacteria bacterium]
MPSNTLPPEQPKKHILLVDDDADIRRIFGAKLFTAGFEVLYARDGNEGREMARRLQPNLVLMDIKMPVMGGLEAATRMKEESETTGIPIIFLTNEDMSIESQRAIKEIGVSGYMPKAVDLDEFIVTVKKTLDAVKN